MRLTRKPPNTLLNIFQLKKKLSLSPKTFNGKYTLILTARLGSLKSVQNYSKLLYPPIAYCGRTNVLLLQNFNTEQINIFRKEGNNHIQHPPKRQFFQNPDLPAVATPINPYYLRSTHCSLRLETQQKEFPFQKTSIFFLT